jgi:hypothetical protein
MEGGWMPEEDLGADWRISSQSQGDHCVAVRAYRNYVELKHSRDSSQGFLRFTKDEWRAFLSGVTQGEFNIGDDEVGSEPMI